MIICSISCVYNCFLVATWNLAIYNHPSVCRARYARFHDQLVLIKSAFNNLFYNIFYPSGQL